MTRDKTATRYHHGNLRPTLLAMARALIEEGGPAALSMREIGRRAGVSAPAAYHYFNSLDAIAASLAEQGFAELSETIDAALDGPRRHLLAGGIAYVAFARANPGLYRLMFGESFQAYSKGNEAIRASRARVYRQMKDDLEKRLTPEDVPIAALFLWSLTHGLALLMIDGQVEPDADLDTKIEDILKFAGMRLPAAR
ncbi:MULTISPECIES: TetR/AcrR family transcriptional regulator [unclassified Rhizobium]|jgi:AcrR family transcriptional regulator|uniref:TetR/AcrR family transcriptional regulator n=1 Tax=unclassified Rhizobium TaxID=2613769 RepID=UPI001A997CF5|nr:MULTISPECIES: TetR/AcrR family transcriptional regulator [unclassified Rhizobium]MBX5158037.1 TetR/AcrR family transcriptional regulator [Rhizobium sp. NZLR8]MBX5166915.1 TetR/AcrR family transcriptional regulator [Rhizobium sp. NZLR4b]MBX5186005.1 TetR/AcrR family transcriptional regulator [Rhizobium sp. NZLR5]MBX5192894.1 TetR/AcrR family transcriptional regulator [Rhizobium sp. NZLR3b]MBX5198032.1 TetR/AcrR family transcriptional regulator [Rhizobium sp. NZLR10]